MPRERRDRSASFGRSRASPYPCSSSHSSKKISESVNDIKEWEEARCPVCIEHPHNAVLLLCSSHEKGCRPYICDTSYRHSNCLDQFRKAFAESSSIATVQASSQLSEPSRTRSLEEQNTLSRQEDGEQVLLHGSCEGQEQAKLSCPLCRGQIKGSIVVEGARQFMNAKTRSCSRESCVFTGTYKELRKHARMEHPFARPSEVDQERQRNWRRLERQRDLGDVLSTIQSAFGEGRGDDSLFPVDEGSWLTVYFLIRVFRPGSSTRRRRTTLWGENYDSESGASPRDNSSHTR